MPVHIVEKERLCECGIIDICVGAHRALPSGPRILPAASLNSFFDLALGVGTVSRRF